MESRKSRGRKKSGTGKPGGWTELADALWRGVVEVVKDFRGDTFRAVYTLRCAGVVFVLHAFQKKSKTARATSVRDMELIRQRLREAEQIAQRTES